MSGNTESAARSSEKFLNSAQRAVESEITMAMYNIAEVSDPNVKTQLLAALDQSATEARTLSQKVGGYRNEDYTHRIRAVGQKAYEANR